MEEVVGGWFGVYDRNIQDCRWSTNPPVNLPSAVITNDIRQISLPNGSSNFGRIEKVLIQEEQEEYFGEAFYLKNDVTSASCNAIPRNADYSNILGTSSTGAQAWYAGHVVMDENTVQNPIEDAGSEMVGILKQNSGSYDENYELYICPVASKSFLNVDSCYLSTDTNACSSTHHKQNDGDAVVVCGSPGEVANDPLATNTFSHKRCKFELLTHMIIHF